MRKTNAGRRLTAGRASGIRKYWQCYLFLLLPIAYLIIFKYWPMLGAQIAFRKYRPSKGIWGSEWVGLLQFSKFFASYYAPRVIVNTLRLSLYSIRKRLIERTFFLA